MSDNLAQFEQTMMPHLNAAHNLARWLIRNPHDAEDAVQEAYLRAFRYFDGFQGGDGRAWLMAVVRNTCMTWLGRKPAAVPFDEHAHGAASDPQTDLKEDPRIGSLRECVEALPREYREVIVLRAEERWADMLLGEQTAKRAATLATGKIAIHSQAPIGAEQARDGASVDWQKTLNPGIW